MSLESDEQSQPYRPNTQKPQIEEVVEKSMKVEKKMEINVIDIEDDLEIVTPAP